MYDNLKDVDGLDQQVRFADRAEAPADSAEAAAVALDTAIREVKKADWRGNTFKEKQVYNAIASVLGANEALVNMIFEIVKAQRDY